MIYIEFVLGLNAVIHVVLVYITAIILRFRVRKKTLIISVLLDALYMLFYMFKPVYYEHIKYVFGIGLMLTTFFGIGIKNIIKASLLYYLENFLLGGISTILYMSSKLNSVFILIILTVLFIVTYAYKEITKIDLDIDKLNYEIMIIDKGKRFIINGYCDTGNFLVSDDFVNVVFINTKFRFGNYIKDLDSQSIGVKSKIKLYTVDDFYIKTDKGYEKKDVYIAFSNLHYEGMFGLGLLGG